MQPKQCFDFNIYDTEVIDDYVKEDGHVVLVALTKPKDSPAVCTTIEREKKNIKKNINRRWECKGLNSFPLPQDKDAFVKLSFQDFQIFTKEEDYVKKLNAKPKVIFFIPSGQVLEYTASGTALLDVDYVGADHCQEGTSQNVWEILDAKKLSMLR